MTISHNIVFVFVVLTIFFGVMFETYSYFFRSFIHKNMVYSTVIANWILYFSRICNVFTMISLAFLLEFSNNISNIFLIFFSVHVFALFYIYFVLYKFKIDIFFKIFSLVIELIFKAKIEYGTHRIQTYKITYKLLSFSFLVSLFIFFSLIFPVIAAYHFFDFRMTLTYTSSIFNFIASGILLSYVEPSFASKASTELYPQAFYNIFLGKIFAQFFIAIIAISLHYIISAQGYLF